MHAARRLAILYAPLFVAGCARPSPVVEELASPGSAVSVEVVYNLPGASPAAMDATVGRNAEWAITQLGSAVAHNQIVSRSGQVQIFVTSAHPVDGRKF